MDKFSFGIGVQCIVLSQEKVLLGQRFRVFGDGSWGLPGGHLERGETIFQAARRELYEETGLNALELNVVAISDPTVDNNYYLQIGVLVEKWTGNLSILEPDKCSRLDFFSVEKLPQPILLALNFSLIFLSRSQKDILSNTNNVEDTMNKYKLPTSINLRLIGDCNLTCPFCYGPLHSIPAVNTNKLLDFLSVLPDLGVVKVVITGGEPLLVEDLEQILLRLSN